MVQHSGVFTDKQRLDWLERHIVEVRVARVYGSRGLFFAVPDAESPDEPSNIRLQIDAALTKGAKL